MARGIIAAPRSKARPPPRSIPTDWPESDARRTLAKLAGGAELVERFELRQERTERTAMVDGEPVATLSLDVVEVVEGGGTHGRLLVVELELASEEALPAGRFEDLAGELAALPGLRPDPRTKLEHAPRCSTAHERGAGLGSPRDAGRVAVPGGGAGGIRLRRLGRRAVGRSLSSCCSTCWPSVRSARWRSSRCGEASCPARRSTCPLLAVLAAFGVATRLGHELGHEPAGDGRHRRLRGDAAGRPRLRSPPPVVGRRGHRRAGAAASVPTLAVMLGRRVEWVLVGAPGLPPIRLPGEGTPFGSVAVPPFVIWPAWALAGLIESPRWRRVVRTGLVVVGVPLTVLSGSRSAWLAMGVTIVAAGVPWAWAPAAPADAVRRPPNARSIGLGLVALAGIAAAIVLVAPRVTAVDLAHLSRQSVARHAGRLEHRPAARHRPGLHAIRASGGRAGLHVPGAPAALPQPAAGRARRRRTRRPCGCTCARRRHRLVRRPVAGPNAHRPDRRIPAAGTPRRGPVRGPHLRARPSTCWRSSSSPSPWPMPASSSWRPLRRRLVLAARRRRSARPARRHGRADAGAIAYRSGSDAAAERRLGRLPPRCSSDPSQIDPWHPAGPEGARRRGGARAASVTSPGTRPRRRSSTTPAMRRRGSTWLSLCAEQGDAACQRGRHRACRGDRRLPRGRAPERRTQPRVARHAGGCGRCLSDARSSASGSRPSRATGRATSPSATRRSTDDFGAQFEFNRLLAWWAMTEPIEAASIADPATRALAHAMRDERADAEAWLERAIDAAPDGITTWDVAIVVRDHWGLPVGDEHRDRRGRARPPVPRSQCTCPHSRARSTTSHRSGPTHPTGSSAGRSASARPHRSHGSSRGPCPSHARLSGRRWMSARRGRSRPHRRRDREAQPALAGGAESVPGVEPSGRDAGEPEPGERLGEQRALAAQRMRHDAAIAVAQDRQPGARGGSRTAACATARRRSKAGRRRRSPGARRRSRRPGVAAAGRCRASRPRRARAASRRGRPRPR